MIPGIVASVRTVSAAVATFIATFTNGTATPSGSAPVGTYTYTRTDTNQTITEGVDNNLVKSSLASEIGYRGQRRVEDLSTGLVTEANIPVISGHEYQVTIQGGNGDTAVCSDAFTGTLTANGTNRISWDSGTPKTATTATLDIAVTGTLTELLVEDVTGQTVQVPSEQIVGTEHGTGVANVMYKNYENAITVNGSGVVDETGNPGTTITVPDDNKGVEVWEARTNKTTYSEQFDTGSWTTILAVITANATTAPDGSISADKITDDNSSGTGVVQVRRTGWSITSDVNEILSIYAKKDQVDHLKITKTGYDSSTAHAYFNLNTGSIGTVDGQFTASSMEDVGNGWYRCSVAFQSTTDVTGIIQYCPAQTDGVTTVDLDGTSSIFIWGADIESSSGAFLTPYIQTVASTETRNADDLNYDSDNYAETGFALLDFFVTADQLANHATSPTIMTIAKAGFADYISAYINNTTIVTVDFKTAAGGTAATADFTVAAGNQYKLAFTWDKVTGAINGSINGGSVVGFTGASAADILAAADAATFEIGKYNDTQFFNGNIMDVQLGASLMTNAELIAWSTI